VGSGHYHRKLSEVSLWCCSKQGMLFLILDNWMGKSTSFNMIIWVLVQESYLYNVFEYIIGYLWWVKIYIYILIYHASPNEPSRLVTLLERFPSEGGTKFTPWNELWSKIKARMCHEWSCALHYVNHIWVLMYVYVMQTYLCLNSPQLLQTYLSPTRIIFTTSNPTLSEANREAKSQW
jgi:hypothetical protein